jgi:hypothetical protein
MNYLDEKFEGLFDYLNNDSMEIKDVIIKNTIVFGSLFCGILIVGLYS